MVQRPKVRTLTEAKQITKIHCGECNWHQLIAAQTEAALKCCPWCGWDDLEVGTVARFGGFQEIECAAHGRVTVLLDSDDIETDDFLNNFFCPFCG